MVAEYKVETDKEKAEVPSVPPSLPADGSKSLPHCILPFTLPEPYNEPHPTHRCYMWLDVIQFTPH